VDGEIFGRRRLCGFRPHSAGFSLSSRQSIEEQFRRSPQLLAAPHNLHLVIFRINIIYAIFALCLDSDPLAAGGIDGEKK